MAPRFFFAPGGRPRPDDIAIALAIGQTAFLVPGCSPAADLLAELSEPHMHVAIDSHITDPRRPSLEAYADVVVAWHARPDRFAFAISYDHLGDPHRSGIDHIALCRRLERLGLSTTDDPVVPVAQRGAPLHSVLGPDLEEWDEVPLDELLLPPHLTPVVAVGGMAFAQYGHAAMSWLATQLIALGRRPGAGGAHLLGLARPDVVRRPGVVSFDSSRPARQAAAGWPAIAPAYQSGYGLTPADLQLSRGARLAYWLVDTRARLGLPWAPVDAADLPDDRPALPHGKPEGRTGFT